MIRALAARYATTAYTDYERLLERPDLDAVTLCVPSGLRAGANAPSNKLNIGLIGAWGRARAHFKGVFDDNVVALCDVDANYLRRAKTQFPDARTYTDYREMIASEANKIDAVVIGAADHHHAPATIRAIRAGLHVYCEKPLTHTIYEARLVAQAFPPQT